MGFVLCKFSYKLHFFNCVRFQDVQEPKLEVTSTAYLDVQHKKPVLAKSLDNKKNHHNTSNQNIYSRTSAVGPHVNSVPKANKSYQNVTIRETVLLSNIGPSKTASTNDLYEMSNSEKFKIKPGKMLSNHSNDVTKCAEDNTKVSNNCHRTLMNKPLSMNEIGRRYSIDSNLRTAAFHRANDSGVAVQPDMRRQSLDSVSSGEPTKQNAIHSSYNPKLVPSVTKQKVFNSILHKTQAVVGKYSTSVVKPTDKFRSSIGLCFRQQPEAASEDNYDSRLKHLEEKIRKHTTNFKATACRTDKTSKANGSENNTEPPRRKINPLDYSGTTANRKFDLFRNSSEYTHNNNNGEAVPSRYTPSKYDIGGGGDGRLSTTSNIVVGDRNYSSHKLNKHINNYGVIRATDLFKIRSPEIIS